MPYGELAVTVTVPPLAPLLSSELELLLDELLLELELDELEPVSEVKLGSVALVPSTTSTYPSVTEELGSAVTPNSAAILAALALAAAPDP
jgi:superfamily II RNA helicase